MAICAYCGFEAEVPKYTSEDGVKWYSDPRGDNYRCNKPTRCRDRMKERIKKMEDRIKELTDGDASG